MFPKTILGFLLAVGGLLAVAEAGAQEISRYDPTNSSCTAIQGAIQAEGAVILRWDEDGIPIYDRFVANDTFCDPHERAVPVLVDTLDGECAVNVCRPLPSSEDCAEVFLTPAGYVPSRPFVAPLYTASQPASLRMAAVVGPCGVILRGYR